MPIILPPPAPPVPLSAIPAPLPGQADDVWRRLVAYHETDAELGHFQALVKGIASPLQLLADIAQDQLDGSPPYAILLDVDKCPDDFLAWLAQFVGVTDRGQARDQLRAEIRDRPRFRRGTPDAIKAAVHGEMVRAGTRPNDPAYNPATDTGIVIIERDGSQFRARVITLDAETPEPPTRIIDAARREKPYGIRLDHDSIPQFPLGTGDGKTYPYRYPRSYSVAKFYPYRYPRNY